MKNVVLIGLVSLLCSACNEYPIWLYPHDGGQAAPDASASVDLGQVGGGACPDLAVSVSDMTVCDGADMAKPIVHHDMSVLSHPDMSVVCDKTGDENCYKQCDTDHDSGHDKCDTQKTTCITTCSLPSCPNKTQCVTTCNTTWTNCHKGCDSDHTKCHQQCDTTYHCSNGGDHCGNPPGCSCDDGHCAIETQCCYQ